MSEVTYTIRPFVPADQIAARALILTGLGEHWGYIDETLNPDLDDISEAYPPETSYFLVAEEDGALIGAGCLTEDDAETGRLVRMSVASAARGKGIGRRLVAELEAVARARGAGHHLPACYNVPLRGCLPWKKRSWTKPFASR